MARPINPTSRRQKLLKLSAKSGIPYETLVARVRRGVSLRQAYIPLSKRNAELRAKAKEEGLFRYESLRPCRTCGDKLRYVASNACVRCR